MSTLYFYIKEQFFNFKSTQIAAGFEFLSMSQLLSPQKIDSLDTHQQYCIDISSTIGFVKANDSQLLNFEQLFNSFGENISFICDKSYERDAKYIFRYVFNNFLDVDAERDEPQNEDEESSVNKTATIKKITDLTASELDAFFENFNARLYGHERFKEEFKEIVESFRVFNKLGEHKILSLFLMGDSGVGKTEVARSIHKALGSKSKLAKVNFGNYSSHDALNSLIGSPLGYIGSDGGELVKRMNESDVGLILIDEFEKADSEIKNFFLELLEDGKFTDSMGREYDLNGYIIVFTSNIKNENEFNSKMSPEFKSRINLICEFNPLNDDEKLEFIKHQIQEFKKDIKSNSISHKKIPENINIEYQGTDDLREIKDRIYNKMQEYID